MTISVLELQLLKILEINVTYCTSFYRTLGSTGFPLTSWKAELPKFFQDSHML